MSGKLLLAVVVFCSAGQAELGLRWLPEHQRPDPFGGIVAVDRTPGGGLRTGAIDLNGARDGYVSCHVLVSVGPAESYTLQVDVPGLQPGLFREWFHYKPAGKTWYPDALVPVRLPLRAASHDDNKIPGQRVQAFWLDVWIPATARAGKYQGTVEVHGSGAPVRLPVAIEVLPAVIPADDVVLPDHNSYGAAFIQAQYPNAVDPFQVIHAHHRIFYEHRGVFHQLGYGHGGKVAPEFAPEIEGSGRSRRIVSWDLYDRHYGPLLDGSAFAGTKRGARPIPFVYLPINPEWPAQFLWWGEKGYETEFVSVVRQMAEHFREKNWTKTRFELFFNHKKRYKAFPWDGDETRFPEDHPYFVEYARLMKQAIPKGSPVKWVFRTDASWTMAEQFHKLAGVIDFWVVSGGMLSLYDWAPALLRSRGDIVWTYGGTPKANEPAAAMATELVKAWLWGVSGYVHWLTVSPGADPWFEFTGGETALVYPGTRFGIDEPIPSIRLKLQRNIVQDLNLLEAEKSRVDKAEITKRFSGTTPSDWWTRNSPLLKTDPLDWNNTDIGDALKPFERRIQPSDAAAWSRVREYTLAVAGGK